MKHRLTVIAVALSVVAAVAGSAEETKGSPPMPTPAPEMTNLAVFDGDWVCEGTMLPGPMGPGGKMSTKVSAKLGMNGFWRTGTVRSEMAGMPPMEGMFHMTYEPGARQYVMLWIDNQGAMARSTSAGWSGENITFSGDTQMGGQTIAGRDTFTKMADGSLEHTAEMQMDGKWSPMMEETCRRPSKK